MKIINKAQLESVHKVPKWILFYPVLFKHAGNQRKLFKLDCFYWAYVCHNQRGNQKEQHDDAQRAQV